MPIARVQARGQVTVPQEVREACGIEPGDELLFVRSAPGRFECRVLPPRESLMKMLDRFAVEGAAPDMATLREEMANDLARDDDESPRSSSKNDGPCQPT